MLPDFIEWSQIMADHELLTVEIIAQQTIRKLYNHLVMAKLVNRTLVKGTTYSEKKIGNRIRVEKPIRMLAGEGEDVSQTMNQIKEEAVNVDIDTWLHCAWNFNGSQLTLNIKDYSRKFIEPAIVELATKVDMAMCGLWTEIPEFTGTPGTNPSAFTDLGAVGQTQDENAVPDSMRRLVLNPAAYWSFANAFKDTRTVQVHKDALTRGYLNTIANYAIHKDQNIETKTPGATVQTGVTVNASLDSNSTLNQIALAGVDANISSGDHFTIQGVYSVNPRNRKKTHLKKFMVTVGSSGAGTKTVTFLPKIIMSDDTTGRGPAYQNVDSYPVAGANVTINGSFTSTTGTGLANAAAQNLAFHRDGLGLVCVPITIPDSAKWAHRVNYKGLSLRVAKGWNPVDNKEICRVDIYFGKVVYYDDLCCRVVGGSQ